MTADEQDIGELDKIFAELYELTESTFARCKEKLDEILVRRYGVDPDELAPWHYHDQFFQETA